MKKLLLLLGLLLICGNAFGYGIVTNTATRDTINIPCNPLDSMGNPVNIVSGDSLWLTVFFPGGAGAYLDSADWTGVPILRLGTPNGPCSSYVWSDQIQDIDGAGVDGVYTYHLVVEDNTGAALKTQYSGEFQIVNSTLESSLDSAGLALLAANKAIDSLADVLDSLETQSVWIQDSLYAVLDSIQIKWADRTGYDPATDSVIVDVSSALVTDGLIAVTADSTWEEVNTGATHNVANSTGRQLRNAESGIVLADGTAQAGGASTIQLEAGSSATDNIFNHSLCVITGGTGEGQSHSISDYDGASVTATVSPAWRTQPDATSTYTIHAFGEVDVYKIEGSALSIIGDTVWSDVRDATLKSLVVSNSAGDAVQLTSTGGNGDGLQIVGEGSGSGIFASTGGNGNGIRVLSVGGEGIGIVAGNDYGIDITGPTADIYLNGSGIISDGTNNVFMSNMYEDLFDEISTGAIVEDSTGNTTTMCQTNLGEATDDHYNGAMVFFIDGTEAGTYRRITDYDAGNGYIVYDPATTAAAGDGDSLRIMPWASVSATATISDADMASIGDTVLGKAIADYSAISGSLGDVLLDSLDALVSSAGGVATITDADMAAIADSSARAVMDSLEVGTHYLSLTKLWVNATGNDDAVRMYGSGTGTGLDIYGGATGSYGFRVRSQATNSYGGYILGKGTGAGLSIVGGNGADADGLSIASPGTGYDIDLAGDGIIDGVIVAGDTTASGYSIACDGVGSRTVTIYTIDGATPWNAATDTLLAGISVEVKDQNDVRYAIGRTNTLGFMQFNATENDTFLVYAYGLPGHTFAGDSSSGADSVFVTAGGNISDTCWASDNAVAAPSGADVCRFYADIVDGDGTALPGAIMVVSRVESQVADTCNSTIMSEVPRGVSDSNGRVTVDVVKSYCLTGKQEYRVVVYEWDGGPVLWEVQLDAPDETTYQILDDL